MYEQFRTEVVSKVMDNDELKKYCSDLLQIIDSVSCGYDIVAKERTNYDFKADLEQKIIDYSNDREAEGFKYNCTRNYIYYIRIFFDTVNKPYFDVEARDIKTFLLNYKKTHGNKDSSTDNIRKAINSFFKWLYEEEFIDKNPCDKVKKIKFEEANKKPLTQIELEYVRKNCKTLRDKAIVELLYSTGLRISDLCNLKKGDVDLQRGIIKIKQIKTGNYVETYLNAKATVALTEYFNSRTDDCKYVIVTKKKPIKECSVITVQSIVSKLNCDNVKHFTAHSFRHTTATALLASGMPIENVQKILGHKNIQTTLGYTEINNEDVHSQFNKAMM